MEFDEYLNQNTFGFRKIFDGIINFDKLCELIDNGDFHTIVLTSVTIILNVDIPYKFDGNYIKNLEFNSIKFCNSFNVKMETTPLPNFIFYYKSLKSFILQDYKGIKAVDFENLAFHPDMESLIFSNCSIEKFSSFEANWMLKKMKNLKTLKFDWLKNYFVLPIFFREWMPQTVTVFHLNGTVNSKNFSEIAIVEILQHLPNLEDFMLRGNNFITENTLFLIAKLLPCLKKTDLAGCNKLSVNGFKYLVQIPLLRYIFATHIFTTTDEKKQMKQLQKKNPHLKILF